MTDIPYSERCVKLKSGHALIWPFRNVARSNGPWELHLDNNALIDSSWFKHLPQNMFDQVTLSPLSSLTEQWLSNREFRNCPDARIDSFLAAFGKFGINFGKDFSNRVASQLAKNDDASRAQAMLTYLYVVLLYRIVFSENGDAKPAYLLADLKKKTVPMFAGCIMLCCVAKYLKTNQNLKMSGDSGLPAISYLRSFLDLHTGSKNENEINENYLRNRALDLSIWLFIPMLVQHNYHQLGEQVVVTQDKVLVNLLFRCLPFVRDESGKMVSSFDERCFEKKHADEIVKLIKDTVWSFQVPSSKDEQFKRLENLRDHVIEGADAKLAATVHGVWKAWIAPGFSKEFIL